MITIGFSALGQSLYESRVYLEDSWLKYLLHLVKGEYIIAVELIHWLLTY